MASWPHGMRCARHRGEHPPLSLRFRLMPARFKLRLAEVMTSRACHPHAQHRLASEFLGTLSTNELRFSSRQYASVLVHILDGKNDRVGRIFQDLSKAAAQGDRQPHSRTRTHPALAGQSPPRWSPHHEPPAVRELQRAVRLPRAAAAAVRPRHAFADFMVLQVFARPYDGPHSLVACAAPRPLCCAASRDAADTARRPRAAKCSSLAPCTACSSGASAAWGSSSTCRRPARWAARSRASSP